MSRFFIFFLSTSSFFLNDTFLLHATPTDLLPEHVHEANKTTNQTLKENTPHEAQENQSPNAHSPYSSSRTHSQSLLCACTGSSKTTLKDASAQTDWNTNYARMLPDALWGHIFQYVLEEEPGVIDTMGSVLHFKRGLKETLSGPFLGTYLIRSMDFLGEDLTLKVHDHDALSLNMRAEYRWPLRLVRLLKERAPQTPHIQNFMTPFSESGSLKFTLSSHAPYEASDENESEIAFDQAGVLHTTHPQFDANLEECGKEHPAFSPFMAYTQQMPHLNEGMFSLSQQNVVTLYTPHTHEEIMPYETLQNLLTTDEHEFSENEQAFFNQNPHTQALKEALTRGHPNMGEGDTLDENIRPQDYSVIMVESIFQSLVNFLSRSQPHENVTPLQEHFPEPELHNYRNFSALFAALSTLDDCLKYDTNSERLNDLITYAHTLIKKGMKGIPHEDRGFDSLEAEPLSHIPQVATSVNVFLHEGLKNYPLEQKGLLLMLEELHSRTKIHELLQENLPFYTIDPLRYALYKNYKSLSARLTQPAVKRQHPYKLRRLLKEHCVIIPLSQVENVSSHVQSLLHLPCLMLNDDSFRIHSAPVIRLLFDLCHIPIEL